MNQETGIPIIGTKLFISANDPNYLKVVARYGETHTIEAVKTTKSMNITRLPANQSVCWGDGETYYFRLTEKPAVLSHSKEGGEA